MKKLFLATNKQTSRMTLEKFFDTLSEFYRDGVTGHPDVLCKFYLQESTFSYELHDNRQPCFTRHSLVFQSQIFDFWNSEETRKEIIADIILHAGEIDTGR